VLSKHLKPKTQHLKLIKARGDSPLSQKSTTMKLHELRPAKGATHKVKRVGRGDGSGHGGTATKGTKGGQSRAGYKRKMAHEGGQMPIQRRIPKRGFKNPHRVEYKVFNIGQAAQLAEKYDIKEFSFENLYINRLVAQNDKVKILGAGELKTKLTFKVNAASEKAKAAIEAAGGTIEIVN
jgi:large subunit ribosomal protein L15